MYTTTIPATVFVQSINFDITGNITAQVSLLTGRGQPVANSSYPIVLSEEESKIIAGINARAIDATTSALVAQASAVADRINRPF